MVASSYLEYPTNKPDADGYYLVSVRQPLILKLGLAPSPSILIARYKLVAQEWIAVLGITSQGLGDIRNEVISWRDLPMP